MLELSLCLFDGSRYFHIIPAPEVNRWLELDIPAGEFAAAGKALGSGAHVQAVTIRAFYPLVYHLSSYTISLDDFILNGERQRRFVAVEPVSTTSNVRYSIIAALLLRDSFAISYGDEVPENTTLLRSHAASSIRPENGWRKCAARRVRWGVEGAGSPPSPLRPGGSGRSILWGKDSFVHETRWETASSCRENA